jgi:drug/metabolite transporter (DMT)-like permease
MMDYITGHTGEFAALAVAFFWTVTALAFESASRKIGSIPVNIMRLVMAFFFIGTFTLISRGSFLPLDASRHSWLWLSLSGLIGLVLGDYFLFKSYALIGSRFSMLIMTTVPPMAAFFGFLILDESLKMMHLAGMVVVIGGITTAIFNRPVKGEKLSMKLAPRGVVFALIGALGQALGLVLSKYGMEDYDPFASTHIRIIAGVLGYSFIITVLGRWGVVRNAMKNIAAMKSLTLGAVFGPFLGISFSLIAVKYTEAGIASTIMAIVPILIIAPSVFIYKEKITKAEVIGAVISVFGVALFFM